MGLVTGEKDDRRVSRNSGEDGVGSRASMLSSALVMIGTFEPPGTGFTVQSTRRRRGAQRGHWAGHAEHAGRRQRSGAAALGRS